MRTYSPMESIRFTFHCFSHLGFLAPLQQRVPPGQVITDFATFEQAAIGSVESGTQTSPTAYPRGRHRGRGRRQGPRAPQWFRCSHCRARPPCLATGEVPGVLLLLSGFEARLYRFRPATTLFKQLAACSFPSRARLLPTKVRCDTIKMPLPANDLWLNVGGPATNLNHRLPPTRDIP